MSNICPVCNEDMRRFIIDGQDAWKCMNVNAHNTAQLRRSRRGGKRPGAGRKPKKK